MTGTQEALWRRWTEKRDAHAFEALVAQTQRFVFDFARRLTRHDADAEDLAQEAFLELAEAPPERPAAVGLKAFLGRRVVLGAKMLKRAALTRHRHEAGAAKPERLAPPETRADAEAALALLDDDDRYAVELRFLHDLSYAEVAHVLGIAEPAARMRVHRALKSLRERLGPRAQASIAALALFAPPRRFLSNTVKAAALVGGTAAMGKKLILVVLLLVVAGTGAYFARADRQAPARNEPVERGAREAPVEEVFDEDPNVREAPKADAEQAIPAGKGSVKGRVVRADGTPLRRTRLQLWGSPAVVVETDDEGRFHIHGDWVGDRDLVIVGANEFYFPLAHVKMKPDEVVQLDLTLAAGHAVEGTVVAAGRPVANADVRFERPGAAGAGMHQGSWGLAKTDAEGRFRFRDVPAGRYELTVDAKGLEPATRELHVRTDGAPVDVVLQPARTLVIRFDALPATLHGAPVTFAFHGKVNVYREGKIDGRGELRVDAPPPGRYVITTLNGSTPLPRLEGRITVSTDAVTESSLTLPPGAGVRGTAPAKRTVLVLPADIRVRADDAGRFAFAFVPAGKQGLWLKHGRTWRLAHTLTVPETGVAEASLALTGVTLRGRLIAEGDTWSKGIALRPPGSDDEIAKAGVDARGRFTIPFVPPGEYDLAAWTEADLNGEVRRIRVGTEDLDLGEIRVLPAVIVPVTVVAPTGTELAGRHFVRAERDGRYQSTRIALDENGQGHMALKPGRWKLRVTIDGLQSDEIEITVAESTAPLRIELK